MFDEVEVQQRKIPSFAMNILEGRGFLMNLKRSRLVPCVKVQWLGIDWVTVLFLISHPEEKRKEIQRVLLEFMKTSLVSYRQMGRILGKLFCFHDRSKKKIRGWFVPNTQSPQVSFRKWLRSGALQEGPLCLPIPLWDINP